MFIKKYGALRFSKNNYSILKFQNFIVTAKKFLKKRLLYKYQTVFFYYQNKLFSLKAFINK